eukprot:UN33760
MDFFNQIIQKITVSKITVVRRIMEHGYHVIFSDADIGFWKDPFSNFDFNCDIHFQQNNFTVGFPYGQATDEPNSGFYFIKSNNATLNLWKDVESYKHNID